MILSPLIPEITIEKIYNKKFQFDKGDEAKKEREQFLETKRIALMDMLKKAYRKNSKSQDEYISHSKQYINLPIKVRNELMSASASFSDLVSPTPKGCDGIVKAEGKPAPGFAPMLHLHIGNNLFLTIASVR